jgi:hypothetical protein
MPFPKTYRTALWWTVIASAVFGLIAGKGTIPRISIVCLLFALAFGSGLVAWEHQWLKGKRKFWVIPTIFFVTAAFFYFGWPPRGLSVVPESVTYDPNDTAQNYIFTVKNNEDEPLYVAQIKLRISSSTLTTSDFQVYVPPTSLRPMYERSGFSDICGMFAEDSKSRPILLVQFFYMAPHEVREI